jgi:hypothetical protein
MSAPPEPPGPGLTWVHHDTYVEEQIALMIAHFDRHVAEEPDAAMREAMLKFRPEAVVKIEQLARTILHAGVKH